VRFLADPARVSPYRPGERSEDVMARYGLDEVVKLASNEYPLPPLPGVMEKVVAAAARLNRYPDASCGALRDALGRHHGVPPERVAVGNGSLELIMLLADALLAPGVAAVFPEPSFALYRRLCDLHRAEAVAVPLGADRCVDLDAMAAAIGPATAVVIVCNPNNPTGTYVPAAAIAAFCDKVPDDVLVIVDEAYNEFVTASDSQDTVELARSRENVCLTRTFSKIHGLCALRVGYAVASETVVEAIDTFRQPFNVNLVAQEAALESLRHQDEVERRRRLTAALRADLTARLEALGYTVLPSEANFVLVDLSGVAAPGDDVCERLTALGAIVRDGAALGLPGWARVSVGTGDEIEFFLERLAQLAASGD